MARNAALLDAALGTLAAEDAAEDKWWKNLKDEAHRRPRLTKSQVKSVRDLDIYRVQHPDPDGSVESRYGMLVRLFGERAASRIMRRLEVDSW